MRAHEHGQRNKRIEEVGVLTPLLSCDFDNKYGLDSFSRNTLERVESTGTLLS